MQTFPWRVVLALGAVGVLVLIGWLSLTPGHAVAASGVPLPLRSLPPPHPWDKLVHMAAYAVGAALVLGVLPDTRRWQVAGAVLVLLFASGLELEQMRVPGRTASIADAGANAAGVALAVAGVAAVRRRARRAAPP